MLGTRVAKMITVHCLPHPIANPAGEKATEKMNWNIGTATVIAM